MTGATEVKMVRVDSDLFESVGYTIGTRKLFIRFRRSGALCFENVPGFRYEGLLNAPRKDAYYNAFIKDKFITKEIVLPESI